MLIVKTKQKEFVFNFEPTVKDIGIKMSGGTDSSIIAYMLSLYKKKYRPDLNLHVITMDHPSKAFQVKFAKQVMLWLENEFDFKFASHTTGRGTETGNYADEQLVLLEKSYKENNLYAHFMGQTTNPLDYHENETLVKEWDWRSEERDVEMRGQLEGSGFILSEFEEWQKNDGICYRCYYPLLFVDKKCVADLYQKFDITDSLFPLTRSCEQETNDFSKHCGSCWWCGEREYGFGRLI
jgi:hypothetical protein